MFLVSTCPYCQTKKIPFDIEGINFQNITKDNNSYIIYFSIFSICRECKSPTIFSIYKDIIEDVTKYDFDGNNYIDDDTVNQIVNETPSIVRNHPDQNLANHFQLEKIIRSPENILYQCPEHVPEDIKEKFREAAQCHAHDCFCASAAMLRLCLETATRNLLTEEADKNKKLYNQIKILLDKKIFSERINVFAHEIRLECNSALHEGIINKNDLIDLFDFMIFLLEDLYTYSQKMTLALEKHKQRKKQGTEK